MWMTNRERSVGVTGDRAATALLAMVLAAVAVGSGCSGSEDDVTTPDVTERAAEILSVDRGDAEVRLVAALDPSSCELHAASPAGEPTSRPRYLVSLPDGTVIDDGHDDAALEVLQACFTEGDGDRQVTDRPDGDAFARLVLALGDTPGPLVLADPAVAPRLLEPAGVEYHEPIVTETDDGATVAFFAENPERGTILLLDVAWRATGSLSIRSTSF
ncbi:MAG: hypothetical protein AAGA93_11625 [Actinomycetota bacterium]